MRRFCLLVLGIIFVSFAVSGCVSISKYSSPQHDEQPVFEKKLSNKEPKVKVDIELLERPDFSRFSDPKTPDNEISGNAGILEGGLLMLRKNFKDESAQQKSWWPVVSNESNQAPAPIVEEPEAVTTKIIKYKVKKGQTLADVSSDVYGTTRKWKKIYNANKDKIKDPNKIYAGQVLNIEVEEGSETPRRHLK